MQKFPSTIENLIREFSKLPGIGRKTAEKFVFYLLKQKKSDLDLLTQSLAELQNNTSICEQCGNLSESQSRCAICASQNRNRATICIVEEIHDLNIIEATGEYNGLYHVLGGTLNPLDGITENDLNIRSLLTRLQKEPPQEIILALNPDMNGETTTLFLKKILTPFNLKVTRLARGLPMGADLEYADEITLTNAIRDRRNI